MTATIQLKTQPAPIGFIEPAPEEGVVAASVYAGGKRVGGVAIEDAGRWSREPGHFVWIGLLEPSEQLLARVQKQFGLHDLAIEDAAQPHQSPKLEQYGDDAFIVARTAQMEGERISFGETHFFVGKGHIVSVRHGSSTSYAQVRQRAESCQVVLSRGEHYVLYAILDFIVDQYMPVLKSIQDEVENLEDEVFGDDPRAVDVKRLYMLRRDLLRLRNAALPLGDVCRRLEHAEVIAIDPALQPLFRDVNDHLRRVQEEIDSLRELLAFAFEASLMAGQAQQTDVARKLTAWAAILAVPTAIAGIYGMNFEHMPELKSENGYYVVIAAMITICVTLFFAFKRSKWL
ncbi:magnesium and cobalt transport protein CorA [Methylopila sp. M107]|uniref:magnesium and cobalt transport protein CorA n=1 Tax=Methylopila sp. M107 TaxID=1101190 RepID=UPI0003759047|nr:magnesium and cobalt transport protein CorA [Methylopila sp. M107]